MDISRNKEGQPREKKHENQKESTMTKHKYLFPDLSNHGSGPRKRDGPERKLVLTRRTTVSEKTHTISPSDRLGCYRGQSVRNDPRFNRYRRHLPVSRRKSPDLWVGTKGRDCTTDERNTRFFPHTL